MTFTPGGAMTPERPMHTSLRLSFALLDPEQLDEGVRRLAVAIRTLRRLDRGTSALPIS
jgi:DNA-binding transcriptional MocR family regulator